MSASTLYLGPAGRFYELPPPDKGWQSNVERLGAVNQAINGTRTVDTFGFKRSYQIDFPHCTPLDEQWLEQCYTGSAGSPLWFRDASVPNLLPAGLADTGGVTSGRALKTFVTPTGSMRLLKPDTLPFSLASRMAISTSGDQLQTPYYPVVAGQLYTFSGWVKGASTATKINQYLIDASGNRVAGSSAACSATDGWQFVNCTVAAPVGATRCVCYFNGAASVIVSSLKWEMAPVATDWTTGGGLVQVYVAERPNTTSRYGLRSTQVKILEL